MTKPASDISLSAYEEAALDREGVLRTTCSAEEESTGDGGLLSDDVRIPTDWPLPLIVQEFIRQESPAVFRTYGAGGEMLE